MKSRNVAAVVAFLLLLGLGIAALVVPVGYTIYSPGPTFNVLGASGGKQIISVAGHRTYRDDGGLRLVTIIPTGPDEHVNILQALGGWVDPSVNVYPHDVIYQKQDTSNSVEQQGTQEMVSSQDNAIAAALRELHVHYGEQQAVAVAAVDPSGPAARVLKIGDVIRAVDGVSTATSTKVVDSIRSLKPGTVVHLEIMRNGTRKSVAVTTGALGTTGASAKQSKVGVSIAPTESYTFPFRVGIHLASNIGGPSAGLMFSLGIYDVLTPGSLTRGKVIAGTGEIDAAGRVGIIGGIQQKLVGAQHDGAQLFLVPAGNCAEALGGNYDPNKMRLVRVTTMAGALADIKAWTANPNADLPRCTR